MSKEAKVVLSLDYGIKNIGTCIAETYTGQTKPLPVIKNNDSFYAVLDNLLSEWRPNIILIGIPPKMSSAFIEGDKIDKLEMPKSVNELVFIIFLRRVFNNIWMKS